MINIIGALPNFSNMPKSGNKNGATFPNPLLEDMTHKHRTDFSHPVEWLDALRTDNVEKASTILQSATKNYKDFLMNGDIPTIDDVHQKALNPRSSHRCSNMDFASQNPFMQLPCFIPMQYWDCCGNRALTSYN